LIHVKERRHRTQMYSAVLVLVVHLDKGSPWQYNDFRNVEITSAATKSELTSEEAVVVKVFKALGDPTRFKIVRMLAAQEELGCGDLQGLFRLSAPALSHHTRVLQEAGLLAVRKEGPFHFFRLRRELVERLVPGLLDAGLAGDS